MTFGWQGFRIDHAEDWAPAQLSGNYDEGYARIASPHRASLQIRWKRTRPVDLEPLLDAYLARLHRDAGKRKQSFRCDYESTSSGLRYRWDSEVHGHGEAFLASSGETTRLFFVELSGTRKDVSTSKLNAALDSFEVCGTESCLWSVMGLAIQIPLGWKLRRHLFQAGKTVLEFERGLASLECVRWGFAEQLLRKQELEPWARAALDLPKATCALEPERLRLSLKRVAKAIEAVAALQGDRNQIVTLRLTRIRGSEQPDWDWLAC